jgi:hypothetical protein
VVMILRLVESNQALQAELVASRESSEARLVRGSMPSERGWAACRPVRARWLAHGDLVWAIVAGVDSNH